MKMNSAAKSLLFQRTLMPTVGVRYHLMLIQGNTHTKTELESNFNVAAGGLLSNIATLITQINSRSGKVLAHGELLAAIKPAMKTVPSLLDFDWAGVTPTVIATGQPDWFLIYPRQANVAYNANGVCAFSLRGTVSDFSGEGDLRVGNRNIVLGETYSLTNCRVRQVEVSNEQ